MNGEPIDYDYIYHPESIPGSDEMPDDEDPECSDCGRPANYYCNHCGEILCGQCMIAHEEQAEEYQ